MAVFASDLSSSGAESGIGGEPVYARSSTARYAPRLRSPHHLSLAGQPEKVGSATRLIGRNLRLRFFQRQSHGKGTADTKLAVHGDLAAKLLDGLGHNGQA